MQGITLVFLLFITMIPISCKITDFLYSCILSIGILGSGRAIILHEGGWAGIESLTVGVLEDATESNLGLMIPQPQQIEIFLP